MVTVGASEEDSLFIPNTPFLLSDDLAGDLVVPPVPITDSPVYFTRTEDLNKSNLKHSQALMKAHFNVKYKWRTFEEGDIVGYSLPPSFQIQSTA